MKSHWLFFITLLCCFSLYASEPEKPETQEAETEEVEPELDEDGNPIIKPDMAPSWKLIDGNDAEVSSAALAGKPYVLHFWATWCPYCKKLQPGLEVISDDYVEKGIKTYAVSFWENPRAKPVLEMENRGLFFPVLIEGDEVAKAFGVVGTPTTIFVNGAGEIAYVHLQSNPNDPQIRVAYEMLLDSMED